VVFYIDLRIFNFEALGITGLGQQGFCLFDIIGIVRQLITGQGAPISSGSEKAAGPCRHFSSHGFRDQIPVKGMDHRPPHPYVFEDGMIEIEGYKAFRRGTQALVDVQIRVFSNNRYVVRNPEITHIQLAF